MFHSLPVSVNGLALATSKFCQLNKEQVSAEVSNYSEILSSIEAISEFYALIIAQLGEKNVPQFVGAELARLTTYKTLMITYSESLSPAQISSSAEGFAIFTIVSAYVSRSCPTIDNREYIEYLSQLSFISKEWISDPMEFPNSFSPSLCSYSDFSHSLQSVCLVLDPLLSSSSDPFLFQSVSHNFSQLGLDHLIEEWLRIRLNRIMEYMSTNLVKFLKLKNLKSRDLLISLLIAISRNEYADLLPKIPALVALRSSNLTGLESSLAILYLCSNIFENSQMCIWGQFGITMNTIDAMIESGISVDEIFLKNVKKILLLLLSKFQKNRINEILEILTEFNDDQQLAATVYENVIHDERVSLENRISIAELCKMEKDDDFKKLNIDWLVSNLGVSGPQTDFIDWLVELAVGSEKGSELTSIVGARLGVKQEMNFRIVDKLLFECFDSDIEEYIHVLTFDQIETLLIGAAKDRIGFVLQKISADSAFLHARVAHLQNWISHKQESASLSEWILQPDGPREILSSASQLLHHPRVRGGDDLRKILNELIFIL